MRFWCEGCKAWTHILEGASPHKDRCWDCGWLVPADAATRPEDAPQKRKLKVVP